VDVNDVSHALQRVIEERNAEDTWQVDSFGGVSVAPTRPPDEVWRFFKYPIDLLACPDLCLLQQAIVLCLDLSESMKDRSGVSRSGAQSTDHETFDYNSASFDKVAELVEDSSSEVILDKGEIVHKLLGNKSSDIFES
jgi:hypothetical protein